MINLIVRLLIMLVGVLASGVIKGPYTATSIMMTNPAMDSSDHSIWVVYPAENGSFPLIAFAHGLGNDAAKDYTNLFNGIVSFGYIIIAHKACLNGCSDDHTSLWWDPPFFGHYYKQQLLAIEWAKGLATDNTNSVFGKLDLKNGVGISGHSMGGQSTVFSSSFQNVTNHNITAAVMHHAFTHEYPAPKIPFLAFTGDVDYVATKDMTESFYKASGACAARGIVSKLDAGHFEPEDNFLAWDTYNPLMPQYTAAWFKLHLDGKTTEFGIDFNEMIYGSSSSSMCGGQDGNLSVCDIKTATSCGPMPTVAPGAPSSAPSSAFTTGKIAAEITSLAAKITS